MKNIERATKKYPYNELGILASMNLVEDIKEMFNAVMDERIASGKMPAANRDKAYGMIRNYINFVWDSDVKVSYYTFSELYDYLANNDICSALEMVQKKSIVTIVA